MSDTPNESNANANAKSADPSTEAEGQVIPVRRRRRQSDEGGGRRGLMIVVPLVAGAAAVVGLVLAGMKDNAIYSTPVDQLISQKARFEGRPVRAEGTLVPGSLMKSESPCEYRFRIATNNVEVPVSFPQCIVPDTFKDVPGMPVSVTVEGKLLADNSFAATNVLAKCPSKYEMQEKAQKGEKMPHAPIVPAARVN